MSQSHHLIINNRLSMSFIVEGNMFHVEAELDVEIYDSWQENEELQLMFDDIFDDITNYHHRYHRI